jgi:DNA-binding transcriptional ArsR family regulator
MAIPEICDLSEVVQSLGLGSTLTDADSALLTTTKIRIEAEVRRFVGHNIVQPATPYVEYLPARPGNIQSVEMYEVVGNQLISHVSTQYGDVLQLPQMWLRSITSIYEDRGAYGGQKAGDFAAGTLLTQGTHYWVNYDKDASDPELNGTQSLAVAGQVIRVGASWSRVPRTIKVTYVAGLTASELDGAWSDIKSVIVYETIVRFKTKKAMFGADSDWLIKSERIGGEYAVTYEDRDTLSIDLSDESKEKLESFMVMAL